MVVRINDRGPFKNGRIIDLSSQAAELLGFQKIGTAKVLVEILEPESRQLAALLQTREAAEAAPSRRIPVSGSTRPAGGFGPAGSSLILSAGSVPRPALDAAYTMDLVAAATIASHLGATLDGIDKTIVAFEPGNHRRSSVGIWGGVEWVNDSKATNPHAALASVAAYDSVILIAGGRNKGLDLGPIVTAPTVLEVIGIGEASAELASVAAPSRFHTADEMAEAVAIADSLAGPGDTVLLAPGCASFDMFSSYQERGDEFARLVRARKADPDGE